MRWQKVQSFLWPLLLSIVTECHTALIEDPNDLYFGFYPKSRQYKISIHIDIPELLLNQTDFNPDLKTMMYAGGLNMNNHLELFDAIIDSYLSTNEYNVVHMDYTSYSEKNPYDLLIKHFNELGKRYAEAILKLDQLGYPAEQIELVGHSLGASMISTIGTYAQSKIGLSVGLDPLRNVLKEHPFTTDCAKFTIAVWTDQGDTFYGNLNANANYMVNNGTAPQPGCSTDDKLYMHKCGHLRAANIWAGIISDPKLFYGLPCNKTYCNENSLIKLGPNTRVPGQFYFITTDQAPWGLGRQGAKVFR